MIYFPFKNYEEFKELFGVNEHGNGAKSRNNKILLSLFKSKALLHAYASRKETYKRGDRGRYVGNRYKVYTRWLYCLEDLPYHTLWYDISTMGGLYRSVMNALRTYDHKYSVRINGDLVCESDVYATDAFEGLCEDGDTRSVRYINHDRDGRVFKMKAGKFLRKLIEENAELDAFLPEQVKIWVCEEFAERWKATAAATNVSSYQLHVDDNFSDIYDSSCCKGNFGSCMVNDGYWTFYRDAVDAKAAYLTDADDKIVARCIIYTEVDDGNGNTLRLAERQYSSDGDETLKRMLVLRLIDAGEIDGYKRVGAGCSDANAFVDTNGESLGGCLSIRCDLDEDDTVSYQDSFKWYDMDERRAYNYELCCDSCKLDTTNGSVEGIGDWSNYNGETIPRDESVYVETRDDYFYDTQVVNAYVDGRRYQEPCFRDDCIYIRGEYYYAGDDAEYPEDYGLSYCEWCDEYYVAEDECYSELTEKYYCSESCREDAEQDYKERNWYLSEYDDEYFESEDDIITVYEWINWRHCYRETTISKETLYELVDDGEATFVDGRYIIDDIAADGEPLHYVAFDMAAA